MTRDESMGLCESVCMNYFGSCAYHTDIFRCGPSEFFNGYAPEAGPPYLSKYRVGKR